MINCAGPFTFYGAPVIEAALDVGAHYCDTTGEQPYMQRRVRVARRARALARAAPSSPRSASTTCPATWRARWPPAGASRCASLDVAYAVTGFGATRGTLHSALEMLGEQYVALPLPGFVSYVLLVVILTSCRTTQSWRRRCVS